MLILHEIHTHAQIWNDTRLLERFNITNYSLLVGVHNRKPTATAQKNPSNRSTYTHARHATSEATHATTTTKNHHCIGPRNLASPPQYEAVDATRARQQVPNNNPLKMFPRGEVINPREKARRRMSLINTMSLDCVDVTATAENEMSFFEVSMEQDGKLRVDDENSSVRLCVHATFCLLRM
jgi:hypothetical protein